MLLFNVILIIFSPSAGTDGYTWTMACPPPHFAPSCR